MRENVVSSRIRFARSKASRGDAARDPVPVRLPLVIRPTPVRLAAIERRVRNDPAFARVLSHRPDLCAAMARALLARDPQARDRFRDHDELAAHLRSLHAG